MLASVLRPEARERRACPGHAARLAAALRVDCRSCALGASLGATLRAFEVEQRALARAVPARTHRRLLCFVRP